MQKWKIQCFRNEVSAPENQEPDEVVKKPDEDIQQPCTDQKPWNTTLQKVSTIPFTLIYAPTLEEEEE